MITNFKNRPGESLLNGYVRFRKLLDYCPHHELPSWLVLHVFYGGLSSENRETVDHVSGGVFMKYTIDQAWELLNDIRMNKEAWLEDLGNKGGTEVEYDCIQDLIDAGNA